MNALKGVIILMTLAIAVLMTLIAYGLYQKSQNPDFKFFNLSGDGDKAAQSAPMPEAPFAGTPALSPAPHPAPQAQTKAFGDISLALPAGARITNASVTGHQAVVLITFGDGATEVWVIDLSTGQTLGKIKAQP